MNFSKLSKLHLNQKVRYVVTGSYNTLIGYFVFVLIFYHLSSTVNHYFLLGMCHLIGTTHNFFSYNFFVFKKNGLTLRNGFKFFLVYLSSFILNLLMFMVLTKIMNWNVYLSQALIILMIAVLGYFLNKYYSFSDNSIFNKKISGHE